MIVRRMQPKELDITINLCNYYKEEAEIPDDEYDQDAVLETIKLYSTQYQYFWFNAFDNGRPVGLIAGCLTKAPWSKSKFYAHCDMIFLLESHRTLDNFRYLYKAFEEWARSVGACELTAGDLGINVERSEKVWSHFGFKQGLWMEKELTDV